MHAKSSIPALSSGHLSSFEHQRFLTIFKIDALNSGVSRVVALFLVYYFGLGRSIEPTDKFSDVFARL
jgi:hypothetical protein